LTPAVLDRHVALQRIHRNLGISMTLEPSEESSDPIIAEYLRSGLYALAVPPGIDARPEPVYVTRLTNLVRLQLSPIWPELDLRRDVRPSDLEKEREGDIHPDPVRRVLDGLNDLRDVCELGQGYWLPCPVRLSYPD